MKHVLRLNAISLLLMMLMCPFNLSASAQCPENEKSMDTSSSRFSEVLLFSNQFEISSIGKAQVTTSLIARSGDKVQIIAYLQRYKDDHWETIKSWNESQASRSISISKDYYVTKGYQYRYKVFGYLYDGREINETTYYASDVEKY